MQAEQSQVEFRIVANSPDQVRKLIVFLQSQFPHSIASNVKQNDVRPGYRGYVTVWLEGDDAK